MTSHRAIRVLAATLFLALALLLATMQAPDAHGAAQTFVVDNIGDSNAATVCDPGVANDCSLRQAITKANALVNAEQDSINFSIGTAGTIPTITFLSAPPPITQLVRIDGGTSPAGRVEVAGSFAGSSLVVRSSNVVIRRLALNRFPGNGLFIDGDTLPSPISNITLTDNRIGIGKVADTDEGNGTNGIEVKGDVSNLMIEDSVIGNNNEYGIRFTNVFTGPNFIESNFIGMTGAGADHGNGLGGILGTGEVTIGGAGQNYISGNTGSGIVLSQASDAVVENNVIGLTSTSAVVPNTLHGIRVSSPGGAVIRDNVISGNLMHGVLLNLSTGTYLGGNYIGLNRGASLARPNGQDGIHITSSSSDIHIGATTERNIISGNTESGIDIESGATFIDIVGNRIGTEQKGLGAVPNNDGITSAGTSVIVENNLLSGNSSHGVHLTGGSDALLVGNYIGTNVSGLSAIANGDSGVRIESTGNQIGVGTEAITRNVISGNFAGIVVLGPGGNVISNNYIGTNLPGTGAIPNGTGVELRAPSILGVDFGELLHAGNVISGNNSIGVDVSADGALIRRNIIGLRSDFQSPLPNTTGVLVTGDNNGVYNNNVRGNTGTGVAVDVIATNNGIANNEIHNNGDLGVDLDWDGPTSNDGDDPDTGGNNLQNFPIIVAAYPTKLHWTLDAIPGRSYIVTAVLPDGGCDPTGFGEGGDLVHEEIFENITGDLDVTWDLASKDHLDLGQEVTMYASVYLGDIDQFAGDTSEFSQCAEAVTEPPPTPTPTPATATPTATPATATPTATATPITTATPVTTATPTATATPIATVTPPLTPTGTPSATLRQGDVTCDGNFDEDDVIALLIYTQIQPGDEDPCPLAIGDEEPITGFEWGDVNCDGAIDGLDALFVLLFAAELETPEPADPGCLPIGDVIT